MSAKHALCSSTFLSAIVLTCGPVTAADLTIDGGSPYTVSGTEAVDELKIGTTLTGQQLIVGPPAT